jgi:flagellar biosynthetic protein FliR
MPFELLAQYLKLPVFALVAARLAGLIMFQPVLGAMAIPFNVRALLVLGLAALVTPLVHTPANLPDTPLALALALAAEVLLGALLSLVLVTCFLGLQLGGLLLAQESGLAFGQIVDPTTEEDESVLGVFQLQLGAVVYLVVGGHRALVSACLDTFQSIPLLADHGLAFLGVEMLVKTLTVGGQVAFCVAAPALLALFLVNVALGFVSRTMPQLNVLAVGFSLKGLLAFLIMAVSLPTGINAFVDTVEDVYQWFSELTHA